MILRCPGLCFRQNEVITVVDAVATEERFRLYLNDQLLTELVASPNQLVELGAGFVVGEGLAETVDSVEVSGSDIRVCAVPTGDGVWVLNSSGGQGTSRAPKQVSSPLMIEPQDVLWMIKEIDSEAWRETGGVHCSVLFLDKELVVRSSDVGSWATLPSRVLMSLGVLSAAAAGSPAGWSQRSRT